ncbi:SDR family oxidoreductase [Novosphingobium sp. PASSN1]|uniref:SDR family NAD(P)-dependent oxidoreductase n=1 Tax=Novosphingobium sp. PASSN1 TaxID=2015561 RepID=UPI0025E6B8A0|nr:SDR family oxidoreductase [Novosphingobium sp. PASSN1]
MSEFDGKSVIITGGGGHGGRALARLFAEAGAKVAAFDISEASLAGFHADMASKTAATLGIACDLRDWDQLQASADRVATAFGGIDILINTATARTNPVWKGIEDCSHAELTELMEVGPNGTLGAMRAVLPYMKGKGGKIINFGSGSGRNPAPGLGAYGMSKAAVHSLTKLAAREWSKYRINVNGILPFMMTPTMAQSLRDDPHALDPFLPPLNWIGDAERDIGQVVLFLASSASDYITGQNLPVDGGTDMMF